MTILSDLASWKDSKDLWEACKARYNVMAPMRKTGYKRASLVLPIQEAGYHRFQADEAKPKHYLHADFTHRI